MIKFGVYDHDGDKDELVGQIVEKFSTVQSLGADTSHYRWYNLYGAPEFKQGSLTQNIRKVAVELGREIDVAVGNSIDYYKYYNTVPEAASTFKGRCLLKFRVESKRPSSYEAKLKKQNKMLEVRPFLVRLASPGAEVREPPMQTYVLKVLLVAGNQLPAFPEVRLAASAPVYISYYAFVVKIFFLFSF